MNEDKLDLILGQLAGIRGELAEVKSDIRTLKGDVQTLKGDVQTLKDDVQTLKVEMARVHTRLDSHEGMLVQLIGIVKSTNEKITLMTERQNEQEFAIQVLNREQLKLKADIEMLKNR